MIDMIPKSFTVSNRFIFKDAKIFELASGVLTPKEFEGNLQTKERASFGIGENDVYDYFKVKTEADEPIFFEECFKIGSVVYFKFQFNFEDYFYSINVDGTALTKLDVGTFPAKPAVATTPDAIDGTYFYTETKDVSGVTHYRLRNKVHPEWVTSWETIYPQLIEDGEYLYVVFKDTVAGEKSGIYVVKHDEQNYFSMLAEKISDDFQIWE